MTTCCLKTLRVLAGIAAVAAVPLLVDGEERRPGPVDKGAATLLPNGWKIAPAGRHLAVGDFPLAMALSPDQDFVIVANNGTAKPTLAVVDLGRFQVRSRKVLEHAWLGLAWHPDGVRLYSAGAASNTITELRWASGLLGSARTIVLAPPQRTLGPGRFENAGFVGGLAVHPDGKTLFAAQLFGQRVVAVDLESGTVRAQAELPAEPYTCLMSADGSKLFVSLWGGAKVLVLDPSTLAVEAEVPVGEHPNAMALSKDGQRLFVACANTNAVWAVDLGRMAAREQISVALYPKAPPGTTPNALAVSPDGKTLLVACADNNTVAVTDIAEPGKSEVDGFVPVGWYPTAVAFAKDASGFLVLNGKGLSPQANPRGPQPIADDESGHIRGLLTGAISAVPMPDPATLVSHTRRVYELTPYSDRTKLSPPPPKQASAIPARVGAPSPIRHVFYVIRENRTYDQVLGDMPQGNGDPRLTLFGEEITPNAHALAREFALFDGFYVDAEVSYDGHAFSMGAYATDVVEKLWPTLYGRRGGAYLSEGEFAQRNAYGNLSAPPDGYLWDFAARAGVSVRSYGEFARREQPGGRVIASVPGLEGRVHPEYPPWDLRIPDNARVDVWLREFREFEEKGGLPRLSIIRLGNDHTEGTRPGAVTPKSMVAENDLALGRLVEAISKSKFWKESAVFVLEDDAQNGPDHVDAHRSVLLVASPYARRGIVDSTLYTTSSVLRTIELILGLPPMSQYDASARPLFAAFGMTPDLRSFEARKARVSLDERNAADAPGAAASMAMNLEEADVAPELELNEVIWKSIRGRDSFMPPPVRAAFVRPIDDDE
jgi:YVTN family beta-propeller protein